MLYRLVRSLILLAIGIFFRRLEVHGRKKIPARVPLLFAANHPNMAMDPFLLAVIHDRRVHFMAKSTLFRWPFSWLFSALGVIPVYRKMDGGAQMDRNRDSFAACHAALEHGAAVGIFPEGTSIYTPRLLPLKTGAARIVFEAEERNGFGLGIQIVPVGLNYLERDTFRSDVLVLFGDPIDPRAFFDRYRADPQAAVHDLTERLEAALVSLTQNLRDDQDARFVERLTRIYKTGVLPVEPGGPPRNLQEEFAIDQGIVRAYAHFADTQPERTRRVKQDVERFLFLIEKLGLTEGIAVPATRRRWFALALLCRLPLLILCLPVVVLGLAGNLVPYRLTGPMAERVSVDKSEIATYKAGFGTLFYLTWYLVVGIVLGRLWGLPAAIVGVACLPVVGLATLEILDRWALLVGQLRAAVLYGVAPGALERVETLRNGIMSELRTLRSEWFALEASPPRDQQEEPGSDGRV